MGLKEGDVLHCADEKDQRREIENLTAEGYFIIPNLTDYSIRIVKAPIVSSTDRMVFHNAEKALIRLASRMRAAKAEIVFKEERDDYVYMGGKYTASMVESMARALYELEKAKEV